MKYIADCFSKAKILVYLLIFVLTLVGWILFFVGGLLNISFNLMNIFKPFCSAYAWLMQYDDNLFMLTFVFVLIMLGKYKDPI